MVSGEFSKLLSVRDTYNQIKMGWVDNDPPSMYGKLFNESSKSLWETKDYGLIGLGEYQDWDAESDTIIPDDADTEYTWTYTMAYYALQFAVTKKMQDFNQWDFVAKCAKSLGRAARQTIETQAFNVFNRAFNSSYVVEMAKNYVLPTTPTHMMVRTLQMNRQPQPTSLRTHYMQQLTTMIP
jgi:hypothetical protein